MKTQKLVKTETNNKAAKFNYKVIDETGAVIMERNSNREYVACNVFGNFFFGRLDLIGKGDHGKSIKFNEARPERQDCADYLEKLNIIAYL